MREDSQSEDGVCCDNLENTIDMRVGIRDRSIEGMVGAADRMSWKRCCCCRVSSLWRVLAVSWAVLGAYAISLTIYYNPTWDTLSWDTSNVKVDLSPRQDLRFRSRGNSTTSAPKY